MKKFLLLVLFLITSHAFSQSLSLFDVDASNFPTIRAKFYAFDAQGNQQRPNLSDLSITENGIPRTITNISCPAPKPPKALSSVLVIDVSGSMGQKIGSEINMDIAKAGAARWVNQIDLGQSECAVVGFDHINYLNQDFTTNRFKLQNAISSLRPQGGTDFNAAFVNEKAGGLLISKTGKYQKVIVFLTDGHAGEPDRTRIINEAKLQSCIIHCVTIGIMAPQSVKDIATQTGGIYFENIRSTKEAENIYNTILRVSQGNDACTIEWKSDVVCKQGNISTQLTVDNTKLSSTVTYLGPNTNVAFLEVYPYNITFENPIIGEIHTKEVIVTARNFAFNVQNITSSNPDFSINPTNFTLQPEQSQKLTINFSVSDSDYNSSKFTFINDLCTKDFYASSWFRNVPNSQKTLKLTHPNGDEIFITGIDTMISWEGIPENEIVRIDYSIDNGDSWKFIDTSSGLSYLWKNIPKPISSNCKMKVTQVKYFDSITNVVIPHYDIVYNLSINTNGEKIVTSTNRYVRVWDVKEKKVISVVEGINGIVKFNPDGNSYATGNIDNTIKIYETETGQMIRKLEGHTKIVHGLDYTKDGKLIASGSEDKSIIIWDLTTGRVVKTLIGHKSPVLRVSFSPDGQSIVSAGGYDKTIKVWDIASGKEIRTINSDDVFIRSVAFSPNGSVFASCGNNNIRIWDAFTGELIHTLSDSNANILSISFSPDGKFIATGSSKNWKMTVKIWDVASGEVVKTFDAHSFWIGEVEYSSDGSYIASCSGDSTFKIWKLFGDEIQSDQSDSVFSIVEPLGASTDIAMGEVLVGEDKDSVVVDFVRNVGSWNFDVRSVSFRGADAGAFSLVSGIPQYRVEPNSSYFGEFRFTPSRVGLHQAEVEIVTQSDTIVQSITGVGIENQLQIHATFIDFGEVEVGNERTIVDTLVLKNVGSNAITIDDTKLLSPDVEQFSILSGGGNFTLGVGEERLVTAQFKPKYIGRTSGRIGFEYNGVGSPAIAHLFGNGIGGLVYVPNDSGYVGDRKSIRLMLGNVKTDAIASIAPKFKSTLRIQNNLLAPISKANTFIQNDSMYFTLQGAIGTTSELAQIPIVVGLGNVDFSWIDIADFTFLDASDNPVDYDFEKQHGSFKILGICQEGGARLIHSSTPLPLLMVSPNPSDGKATIELNLIEDGVSALKIFNSNGFLMEKMSFTTSGSRTIEVDTKNFSNGLYFITIETPTLFDKAKLMLVR